MITEEVREKRKKEQVENGIRLCEETLAKAEKYERLKDNKDWLGYLDDLKILIGIHQKEIQMGVAMLVEASNNGYMRKGNFDKEVYVSSKSDWADFITRHEIQRTEAENWIKEPERILSLAKLSREKLPILKAELQEIHASTNGKS